MSPSSPVRILFTGYAPVHFLCFRPLFERLASRAGVEIFVSGGLRTPTPTGYEYDPDGLYGPFGIDPARVLTVEQIQDESFDLLFTANTKFLAPRDADVKIQVFHGVSFRNRAVRAKNMDCDKYFLVGPRMRRRFCDAGLMTPEDPRAVSVGFMKTDALFHGRTDRGEVLEHVGFSGERPTVLYAPTGLVGNSLDVMGESVIEQVCLSGRYDLMIKLHDHPKDTETDWPGRISRFVDDHCKLVSNLDVVPLLSVADLLISDASSVSSEYTLLDRPIVFLDVPKIISASRKAKDSMAQIDSGRWTGLLATSADSVVPAVELMMEHPEMHAPIRQAAARDLFYNPGSATDTAMQWLEDQGVVPREDAASEPIAPRRAS